MSTPMFCESINIEYLNAGTDSRDRAVKQYAIRCLGMVPWFVMNTPVRVITKKNNKPFLYRSHILDVPGTIVVGEEWDYQNFNNSIPAINVDEFKQAVRNFAVRFLNVSSVDVSDKIILVDVDGQTRPRINPFNESLIMVGEKWDYQKFNNSYNSVVEKYFMTPVKKLIYPFSPYHDVQSD